MRRLRMPLGGGVVEARAATVLGVLTLATLALALVGLGLGDYPMGPGKVLHALLHDDGFSSTVVREWRAPRVLGAAALGAALAVSGAVFQSLTRNPLGSPDIIGFTTGAWTGVLVCGTVLPSLGLGGVLGGLLTSTAFGALAGGLGTAAVVYALAWRDGILGLRLVVVGIGVTAMLHAVNLYLLLRVQAEVAMAATIWGTGSLSLVGWHQLLPALAVLVASCPALALLAPSLRQLELGDDAALAHGVRVERVRIALMGLAVVLVAAATAAAGPIAFVALAAPQIAHRLLRGAGTPLLGSAVVGAFLLLGADVAAQHFLGADVPVGVVTVVAGGCYLLGLMVAQVRR